MLAAMCCYYNCFKCLRAKHMNTHSSLLLIYICHSGALVLALLDTPTVAFAVSTLAVEPNLLRSCIQSHQQALL